MECNFIAHLEIHLTIGFTRKPDLKRIGTVVMMAYQCSDYKLNINKRLEK